MTKWMETIGQNFASRITAALFPLTIDMLHAMSDEKNAINIESIIFVPVLYL